MEESVPESQTIRTSMTEKALHLHGVNLEAYNEDIHHIFDLRENINTPEMMLIDSHSTSIMSFLHHEEKVLKENNNVSFHKCDSLDRENAKHTVSIKDKENSFKGGLSPRANVIKSLLYSPTQANQLLGN